MTAFDNAHKANSRLENVDYLLLGTFRPEDKTIDATKLLMAAAQDLRGFPKQANGPATVEVAQLPQKTDPLDRRRDIIDAGGDEGEARPKSAAATTKPESADARLAESLKWLEKAVEIAEKTDTKQEKEKILEGQTSSLNIIETLADPSKKKPTKSLENVLDELQSEKFQHYRRYLDPVLAKSALALAKISSGQDEQIKQGEKSLIALVAANPGLQFNDELQTKIRNAYKQMETNRQKNGLPAWNGELKPENASDPKTPKAADPFASLTRANKTYAEEGGKKAAPEFVKAIDDADGLPHDNISKEMAELFCRRLTIERSVIAKEVRGEKADDLNKNLKEAKEKESAKYQEYLAPAIIRANAAFAMISSGDPELFTQGKKYLADAIGKRVELEFNQDYQDALRLAFENHFKNKPKTDVASNSQTDPDVEAAKRKREPIQFTPKPFQVKDLGSGNDHELENDAELKSYVADKVTGPILTVALLYLGYRVSKNQIQRIRARRAAAAAEKANAEAKPGETKPKTDEEKPGEQKPGEQKPGEQKPGEQKPGEQKPGEQKPGEQKPGQQKPAEQKPAEQRANEPNPRTERSGGTGGDADELRVETSPFESSNGRDAKVDRPTNAMEAGKMIEIKMPGGLVARIAKAEAPKFIEKMEREFKTEELGKFFDELANDKNLSEEERSKYRKLKENYDKLDVNAKEEVKAEFFENMRAELGVEGKADVARTGRVARGLGYAAVGLGIAILTAAFLRYTLDKARTKYSDKVNIQFNKKE